MSNESKLIDVANEANVSITTASFVLNGRGNISNVIRERVLDAATKLNYTRRRKPKPSNRPETYALIVDMSPKWGFIWPFYEPIMAGLHAGFDSKDFNPIIVPYNAQTSAQELVEKLRLMDCRMVFVIECENEAVIDHLEKNNIKVILINDSQYKNRFHNICQDDVEGAYESTKLLTDHGHRNIWIIDRIRAHTTCVTSDRFLGYKKALDEASIEFEEDWRTSLQTGLPKELEQLVSKIANCEKKPTALYIHGDYLAHRILVYLIRDGIHVPDDISIIAHGDVLNYEEGDPFAITTMKLDTHAMGQLAAQAMINRFRSQRDNTPQSLKLRSTIVERGSIATRV